MISINFDYIDAEKAINKNGIGFMSTICMEEAGELVQALSKIQRYPSEETRYHLAEEIADVLISVNAMVGAYDLDSYVKEWLERKYERNKDTYRWKEMKKRGRPTKDNKRDDSYRIRLNAEEKQMLTQISEWSGLTKADAIRTALFAYYDIAKSNKNTSINDKEN